MKPHRVDGLEWAEWAQDPFRGSPKNRLSAPMRAGLAFQRRLGKALLASVFPVHSGPWIRFKDASGVHFAQPDFLLWPASPSPVVVEVKLTFCPEAFAQLSFLYVPLLEKLLCREVRPIVVCKNLGSFQGRVHSLAKARELADLCPRGVFFWNGDPLSFSFSPGA